MSKFLRIVEETLPSEHNNELSEMVDELANLLNQVCDDVEVVSTSPAEDMEITIDDHIIKLKIISVHKSNESFKEAAISAAVNNSDVLDNNVSNLAAKANSAKGPVAGPMGNVLQKAKTAVTDRAKTIMQIGIPVYQSATAAIKKVAQGLKQKLDSFTNASNTSDNSIL
jgi:hypothetical protein